MESYILHAHGFEDACAMPVQLRPGENIVMICNDGCPLDVLNLSEEFMNKHLIKSKSSERFMELLKDPSLAGSKYAPLTRFFNDIMCNFTDEAPELTFSFDAPFLTGLFQAPINIPHKAWLRRDTTSIPGLQWTRDFDTLSDVVWLIREKYEDKGFILLLASCRSHDYNPPQGTKIRKAQLSRKQSN